MMYILSITKMEMGHMVQEGNKLHLRYRAGYTSNLQIFK